MNNFANVNQMRHRNRGHRVTYLHSVAWVIAKALNRWQRIRASANLRDMDDRLLEDIGIARNDIPQVVADLFRSDDVPQGRTAVEQPRELRRAA